MNRDKVFFIGCLFFADLCLAWTWPTVWNPNLYASAAILLLNPQLDTWLVWAALTVINPNIAVTALLAVLYRAAVHQKHQDFNIALGIMAFSLAAMPLNEWAVSWHHGATLDARLVQLDHLYPNMAVVWLLSKSSLLRMTCYYAYLGIGTALAAIYALNRSDGRWTLHLLWAGVLGFIVYQIFPAVGPAHIGDPKAPINCIPSLHFGWCLIALYHARTKAAKWLAGSLVGLMALATLGFGEHYLIDLLVAIPFCWAVVNIPVSFSAWRFALPTRRSPGPLPFPH